MSLLVLFACVLVYVFCWRHTKIVLAAPLAGVAATLTHQMIGFLIERKLDPFWMIALVVSLVVCTSAAALLLFVWQKFFTPRH